jgi:phenylpropionate dioxygenase-like ring-hydroxylating dioxygenase large terminal subunit
MSTLTREEQNRLLTQTGPGTPMGDLFRRYWIPALLAEELTEPGGPPVRVCLLSEKLIAFRDSSGRLGLMDEFCAHRNVSLWFGRNEDDGLRCPYHGWKYDVTGQCTEIPSEQRGSTYCTRIKLRSYKLVERGGVLWTYMGPTELEPELPQFEFATVGDAHRYVSKRYQECNYLQALEGGIDPNHVAFLHSGEIKHEAMIATEHAAKHWRQDLEVKLEAEASDGGMIIAYGRQSGGDDKNYWRVQQWVMPNFTLIPPFEDHPVHGHFWVPIDDGKCWAWTFDYHPTRELTRSELDAARAGRGLHAKVIPGTYMPVANKANNYLIDRDKQRAGIHYNGVEGIAMQDTSLQESMGPIQDRTKEHLVSSDKIIVMARRMLLAAATSLHPTTTPPGTSPASQRVRSAATVLAVDVPVIKSVKPSLEVKEGEPYLTH